MHRSRARFKHKKLLGIIVAILVIGGVTAYLLTRSDKSTSAEPVITHSTDQPDESKANADSYKWKGAPDEPKKLTISKIGVDSFVQKAGIDQNREVAVPNNVHLTGWFIDSVKPGQKGLSIIAGHVSGQTTKGVFENLKDVKQGDEFQVELGNGTTLKYKVISTQQVPAKEAASTVFSQNPKVASQVNLVTCGGKFNASTDRYDDRIIVAGELIQ